MPSPPLLRVANLCKRFGQKVVLTNINFDVGQGEIFGIIGPSGVGKTTLLECVVGFLRPESGEVALRVGEAWYSLLGRIGQQVRRLFGFASQYPSFYANLTVHENLHYFGTLYDVPNPRLLINIEHLLNLVGLGSEQATLAGNLSGGMQKRLEIACALVHNPPVLLLDEPTADLDQLSRKNIWSLIKAVNARGTTIIMASHFLQEMEQLCTRVAVLHRGSLATIGTVEQLKKRYEGRSLGAVFERIVVA